MTKAKFQCNFQIYIDIEITNKVIKQSLDPDNLNNSRACLENQEQNSQTEDNRRT